MAGDAINNCPRWHTFTAFAEYKEGDTWWTLLEVALKTEDLTRDDCLPRLRQALAHWSMTPEGRAAVKNANGRFTLTALSQLVNSQGEPPASLRPFLRQAGIVTLGIETHLTRAPDWEADLVLVPNPDTIDFANFLRGLVNEKGEPNG